MARTVPKLRIHGHAVDPTAEKGLGFRSRGLTGRDLDAKPGGEVEAIIGTGLAKSMNVKVGDGLTLLAMTSDGALNGVDVEIVGIVNSGISELDARYLRITLPAAQRSCRAIASPTWWLASIPPAIPIWCIPNLFHAAGLSQEMTLKK